MGDTLTKEERYVLHRAEGLGSRESARMAGLSGGVPSPGARRLWEAYKLITRSGPRYPSHIKKKLKQTREKLQELETLDRAYRLASAQV